MQARACSEALSLAAEHKDDLQIAIIDSTMPFLDGKAMIRALRESNPSLRIVRMSGVVEAADNVAADRSGELNLLQKPFSGAQLLDAVKEALRA